MSGRRRAFESHLVDVGGATATYTGGCSCRRRSFSSFAGTPLTLRPTMPLMVAGGGASPSSPLPPLWSPSLASSWRVSSDGWSLARRRERSTPARSRMRPSASRGFASGTPGRWTVASSGGKEDETEDEEKEEEEEEEEEEEDEEEDEDEDNNDDDDFYDQISDEEI